jgi:hypothetical protein
VREQPLFATRPSLHALERAWQRHPATVFTGIGVASGRMVSRALPLDTLGQLLAAEQVRRAIDAQQLIVLVADAHAIAHGAPPEQVCAQARETARQLRRIARVCKLGPTHVVHGSELERDDDYRAALDHVRQHAPSERNEYVLRELADMAHFDSHGGGIVKVGWALQASPGGAERDERMFDERFRRWLGREIGLLYCKPGRALDDQHPKMAPYLESEPARRICLQPGEDVHAKLERARARVSRSTLAGVRKHLRAITRTYGKLVRPLHGSLEARTEAILRDLQAADSSSAAQGALDATERERW